MKKCQVLLEQAEAFIMIFGFKKKLLTSIQDLTHS